MEWPSTLDVPTLLHNGWQPVPFRQFVIKIHSRCDLACDYCYVYEMADQSWRSRARQMSRETAERLAGRIAEHAQAHDLGTVELVLHGGEPLLAGQDFVRFLIETARREAGDVEIRPVLQTNGTLLDTAWLRLCDELGVRVGVSLDGDAEAHDRHRRRPDGRGSHAAVTRALELLTGPSHRHLFGGLLCTVDLRNDPLATYEALLAFQPPTIDFLLPHGHWSAPPPGHDPVRTPYAAWLITIFDRWYTTRVQRTGIRLFTEIIHLLLGGASTSEEIGLSPAISVTVETDGEIEQSDLLKSVFDGAPATGLHVARDPFDAALMLPAMAARQIGRDALSPACLACPEQQVCGGGLYVHRYRRGWGFANPSVYCADLLALISHIRRVVQTDVTALTEGQSPK
jgi:uncharacterized protein